MQSDEVLTPLDVERAMSEVAARIEEAPKHLKGFHEAVRAAKAEHRRAYALAYSRATGTNLDRKMEAELETQEQADALDDAEIAYRYAKDTFDSLRTKLRALQSMSSIMKASMGC